MRDYDGDWVDVFLHLVLGAETCIAVEDIDSACVQVKTNTHPMLFVDVEGEVDTVVCLIFFHVDFELLNNMVVVLNPASIFHRGLCEPGVLFSESCGEVCVVDSDFRCR